MTQLITKYLPFLLLFLAFFAFSGAESLSADDRTENIDVYLVIDKSLSMEEEISAVKNYISDSIVDELLIPGDNLVVIVFYGNAERLYSGETTAAKEDIRAKLREIRADGRFTDIGNALDTLRNAIPDTESDGRRKYMLLITDGIQEAPPESPYYAPDGGFTHEFLANTKEILMEGWKVHILGIGANTAAREVAEELSGTYTEVSETPTVEEMAAETKEFLGTIERMGNISLRSINDHGSTTLNMVLTSDGYSDTRTVTISRVTLVMPDGSDQQVLADLTEVEIPPGESVDVVLQLKLDDLPPPGVYTGDLIFSFVGQTAFSPAGSRIEYRVAGFLVNNIFWLIPTALVVLAALVLLGFFLPKMLRGGSISFVCTVDDGTVRKRQHKLKYSTSLFLVEGMMGLALTDKPGADPAAEITADGMGLHLTLLDEKNYSSASAIPVDVRGEEILIIKKYGKKAKIGFQAP